MKSNVGAPGRGESFLNGSHWKGSRYGHQDTCTSLTILMKRAYQKANYDRDFSSWIAKGKDKSVLGYCAGTRDNASEVSKKYFYQWLEDV